ncbi:MAG: hypothetical protein LBC99_01185 [Spirochaetota bacterium]|nr:hypothetical protein [Spirochaetota bacterium]
MVVEFQFVNPGFTRCRFKNLLIGSVPDRREATGDKC